MNILIGIPVWNEEDIIAQTLVSLYKQSIFKRTDLNIEIIILANACKDNTVDIAEKTLKSLENTTRSTTHGRVINSPTPGKINAWNDIMHKHSTGDDQYIIFMDGDIIFIQEDNLEKLINALVENHDAWISTDQPIKDVSLLKNKSFSQSLSLSFSKFTQKSKGQLCGQLYCGKSSFLRRMAIPNGIFIEDTFVKYMATTNGLTEEPNNKRLINVDGASHLFEAYTGLNAYFSNQVRQTISFTIWRIFKRHIKENIFPQNALEYTKDMYFKNPDWFSDVVRQSFEEKKYWHIYKGALKVRFHRLKLLRGLDKIKMLPPVTAAWLLDLIIFMSSNRRIKTGKIKNIWPDTQSRNLAKVTSLQD